MQIRWVGNFPPPIKPRGKGAATLFSSGFFNARRLKMVPANKLKDSYIRKSNLTPSQRLLLMTIKDRIGNNTDVKIGIQTLAEDTGLHQVTVKKLIKALDALGWLKVRGNTREFSKGKFGKDHSTYSLVESRFTTTPSEHHTTTLVAGNYHPSSTALLHNTEQLTPKQNQEQTPLAKSPANLTLVVNNPIEVLPMNLEEAKQVGINKGILHKKNTNNAVSQLEGIWRDTMTLLYPTGEVMKPSTGKDIGMFKLIKNGMGSQANEAFTKVLEDWPKFVEYVNDELGESKVPTKPFLPYIAANIVPALGFLTYTKKEKVMHTSAPTSNVFNIIKPSTTDKPLHFATDEDDDGDIVSLEDIMSIGAKYGLK